MAKVIFEFDEKEDKAEIKNNLQMLIYYIIEVILCQTVPN